MAGRRPQGEHVVLFDDDHYYMGGVLAELLVAEGRRVTLVTPAARVSDWADHTMEVERIQGRLLTLGVELRTGHGLVSSAADGVRLACAYTAREHDLACDGLVLVTARLPEDALAVELAGAGASSRAIGDAFSPSTIAAAVWDGRRYAEELDQPDDERERLAFVRETVQLAG
jgi:dimethylamine/trimethylamine dehydrogenase